MSRVVPLVLPVLLLLGSAASLKAQTSPVAAPASEPAFRSDPKFVKAVSEARDRTRNAADQRSQWQKANKIAGYACIDCMREIVMLDYRFGDWKDMQSTSEKMEAAATLPKDKIFAAYERGVSLLPSEKSKPEQLQQADAAFRRALSLAPHLSTVEYQEGRVLALLGRGDDAKAMFTSFLQDARPSDSYRIRAEHFAADPHLATLPMAPPFTVRTLQGEEFSLDNMQGKVVLLDFWASWCGPCRETLPEVRHVVEKFAGQPLVVVSISIDRDEAAWKKAMDSNHMTWPQYRDANGSLATAYGANSIPRFFTIDTDGALQSMEVGSDANIEGHVRKLVNKALEAQKRQAQLAQPVAGQ